MLSLRAATIVFANESLVVREATVVVRLSYFSRSLAVPGAKSAVESMV